MQKLESYSEPSLDLENQFLGVDWFFYMAKDKTLDGAVFLHNSFRKNKFQRIYFTEDSWRQ